MPFVSERQELLDSLHRVAKMALALDDMEFFDEILELICFVESTRYLTSRRYINLRKHLRDGKTMEEMMARYREGEFIQTARMKKRSFQKLVDRISGDAVFKTGARCHHQQAPVWVQLLVVLQRLGCEGNGVSVGRVACNFGFSNGAVNKFTDGVYAGIRRLRDRVIFWPDAEERREISRRMDHKFGFPGAVGMLDGTPAVFSQKPGKDG